MPDRNHCSTLFIPGFMAGACPVLAGGGGHLHTRTALSLKLDNSNFVLMFWDKINILGQKKSGSNQ